VADFKINKALEIKKMDTENRILLSQNEAAVRLLPSISSTYTP
jgi:hypothetical protein